MKDNSKGFRLVKRRLEGVVSYLFVLVGILCWLDSAPARGADAALRDAQIALREQKYDPGPVDGLLGSRTRAALELFQRDHELPVSGRLDGKTYRLLVGRDLPESSQVHKKMLLSLETKYLERYAKNPQGISVPAQCGPSYIPNYSLYHTIVHLEDVDVYHDAKKKSNAEFYLVIIDGVDSVTNDKRRVEFGLVGDPFFSSKLQMVDRFGEPGTRITFDGDSNNSFSPIAGSKLWQGAIDIDPICGVIVRASGQLRVIQ